MCGKVAFRNIMNIILVGVDALINERTTQTYGILLEKSVHLSLEIFILVMERDLVLADVFRPIYQVFIPFYVIFLFLLINSSLYLIVFLCRLNYAALGRCIISKS